MLDLSFLPLVLASLASVVLGASWYAPRVFGAAWMQATGLSPEAAERAARWQALSGAVAFIGAFITAFVIRKLLFGMHIYNLSDALLLALLLWAGLAVPPLLGPILWEGKPLRLFVINASYWLASFLVMAAIFVA